MLDGRALAEDQVLPPIWCSRDRQHPQGLWGNHDACLLQYLQHASLLPCLPEHLVATGERELAVALARERTANHQQTSPERHQYDHYSRRVVILDHLYAVSSYDLSLWETAGLGKAGTGRERSR